MEPRNEKENTNNANSLNTPHEHEDEQQPCNPSDAQAALHDVIPHTLKA
jgi:hypothetical protein